MMFELFIFKMMQELACMHCGLCNHCCVYKMVPMEVYATLCVRGDARLLDINIFIESKTLWNDKQ